MDNCGNNRSLIHTKALNSAATVASAEPCLDPCWYAISTRSRQEKVVAQAFAAKRIEHFLPLVPHRRRWSDRCVTVFEPLFPGYVLVHMAHSDHARRVSVLECRSVVGFIGDGRVAWPIPEAEVASVKAIIQSRLECSPYPYLKKGSFVDVIHGPLAGSSGMLIREPNGHRLVVSISLFTQSVSVEVDVADVRPCEAGTQECLQPNS